MVMHFRSIWISDTHLGGKNIQSRKLLEFLNNTESEYLYLVGGGLDLQQFARKWYWPEINNRIVRQVLAKAKNGTRVVYLPGNPDGVLRNYCGNTFSKISTYQKMGLLSVLYMMVVCFLVPAAPAHIVPDISLGIEVLWTPGAIVGLQMLWLVFFFTFGRSTMTSSTASFELIKERI